MIRVHIVRPGGTNASTASKALGFVLVVVGLACAVLLFLGLWILLAVAVTAMAVVALVRAFLPRRRARGRTAEGHAIIEGRATTLDDVDEGESSTSPFPEGRS